jgi:hypothetical protein
MARQHFKKLVSAPIEQVGAPALIHLSSQFGSTLFYALFEPMFFSSKI